MPRWGIDFNPRIHWAEFAEIIVDIEAYKRSVLKLPIPPELKRYLDQLIIVRQVKGTTGIEGNSLSDERIERLVAEDPEGNGAPAVSVEEQEVRNAHRVLIYIRNLVDANPHAPITEELIREFHRRMTDNCHYAHNIPGRYRQHNVTVADYYAPDHDEIPDLMRRFLEFINSRESTNQNALVRAITAHFYLISIHPFADGNGRTSRALEAYILCQSGYNVRGFYSLANFFYRHREEYIPQLQDARFKYDGNLTEFARFALDGYKQELEAIQEVILDFVERRLFRDIYWESARKKIISPRCVSILEFLTFVSPKGIPMAEIRMQSHSLISALYRKVSVRTLQRDLNQLMQSHLAVVHDDTLLANLEMMKEF